MRTLVSSALLVIVSTSLAEAQIFSEVISWDQSNFTIGDPSLGELTVGNWTSSDGLVSATITLSHPFSNITTAGLIQTRAANSGNPDDTAPNRMQVSLTFSTNSEATFIEQAFGLSSLGNDGEGLSFFGGTQPTEVTFVSADSPQFYDAATGVYRTGNGLNEVNDGNQSIFFTSSNVASAYSIDNFAANNNLAQILSRPTVTYEVNAVPEPSSAFLLGLGVAGLFLRRKR